MKKYTKLLISLFLLITAAVMVVVTSFAWLTMSQNPVVQGIQITISGSHTVLVAPDVSVQVDGKIYHYPGEFSDKMDFSQENRYSYLKDIAGLVPVSTVDGENWYIPEYYDMEDPEVISGEAYAGQLKPTSEFYLDNMLFYSNLFVDQREMLKQGHYVYIDFWVVAPVDGYKLRVSAGDPSAAGTYVIDLMTPEQVTNGDSVTYELTQVNQQAAASMRLGFLVNHDTLIDDSMLLYTESPYYKSSYSRLQGVYFEDGYSALNSVQTKFTIFEPNGDLHPNAVYDAVGNQVLNGYYVQTEPLGDGGLPTSIQDRLTVQLTNNWIQTDGELFISQMFRTFMFGRDIAGETAISLKNKFLTEFMQYQIHPYITKGNFLSNTESLYKLSGADKMVTSDEIGTLSQGGATEDVYITELTGGVPQRIRMFVWLEGQDVDCINYASTGSFAISLELAGSNAK